MIPQIDRTAIGVLCCTTPPCVWRRKTTLFGHVVLCRWMPGTSQAAITAVCEELARLPQVVAATHGAVRE